MIQVYGDGGIRRWSQNPILFYNGPCGYFNAIYLTKLELSLLTYIISGGGGVKVS